MKETFENIGGKFLVSEKEFAEKLSRIKAFVFDWDGVFTDGRKDHEMQSTFTEIDSMGSNLLRFAYFLKHGALPVTSVISGENNRSAFTFVKRECFHSAYYKVPNKIDAAAHLCRSHGIKVEQIAFVFDDVLDLSLAERCGLRIYIPRRQNPLFNDYIIKNKLAEYLTTEGSGNYAVRESCELMIGTYGNYTEVIKHRSDFSDTYKKYLALRKATKPEFYTHLEGTISPGLI